VIFASQEKSCFAEIGLKPKIDPATSATTLVNVIHKIDPRGPMSLSRIFDDRRQFSEKKICGYLKSQSEDLFWHKLANCFESKTPIFWRK
jgi:hypothetical protein